MKKERVEKEFEILREKRRRLFVAIEGLSAEALAKQPIEGKWSILQILYHLLAAERGTLQYINKKLSFSPDGLPKASLFSGFKLLALRLILASPLKFKAPKGLDVFPEQLDIQEIRREWDLVDSGFSALNERLSDEQLEWQLFKHPIIGRISMLQTAQFMISHLDHHVRQIERLIG
jgi:hypothetical protein